MNVADMIRIQQTVLDFAARDQGRWEELLAQFHPDGRIQVSWFRGAFATFVELSRRSAAAAAPVSTKHLIAAPRIRLAEDRAVADTDIVIMLRLKIAGHEVDVTSYARFHDWFERRADQWRVLRRVCIYERDRLDPVGDATEFAAVRAGLKLDAFPPAYRHLAGALTALNAPVQPGQVCAGSESEKAIFAADRAWLAERNIEGTMAIDPAGASSAPTAAMISAWRASLT